MSKIAIVTGASRGIGYEICRVLADQKHHSIAVARSKKRLSELERTNDEFIHAYPADLTNERSVHQLIEKITTRFGGIDILINNAGALINKPFAELSLTDWRSQIESNLMSAINITTLLLSSFNKHAHIVNISSMGGYQGSIKFKGLSAYSVSKGALSILTECLTAELSDKNIHANALCLGAVQTEMFKEAFPDMDAPVTAEEMGQYIADFALNGAVFYNGKILPVALENPQ